MNKKEHSFPEGIWKYGDRFTDPPPAGGWVSLGEGMTAHQEMADLARDWGLSHLVLKREDQNPTGSIKDRSLAYMVSHYKWKEEPWLTLSSSGNAAIAAAACAENAGIGLVVFLSTKTPGGKIEKTMGYHPQLILTPKPINFCNSLSKNFGIPNLRPSKHPLATEGYKTIAYEIDELEAQPVDHLFVFSTSASSLVGIGRGFEDLKRERTGGNYPALHCVQSGPAHSIAAHLHPDQNFESEEGPAGSLAVHNTDRREEAVRLIRQSGGDAWFITPKDTAETESLLKDSDIQTSPEGAAVLAAIRKASPEIQGKRVLGILSGTVVPLTSSPPGKGSIVPSTIPPPGKGVESYLELKRWAETHIGSPQKR